MTMRRRVLLGITFAAACGARTGLDVGISRDDGSAEVPPPDAGSSDVPTVEAAVLG